MPQIQVMPAAPSFGSELQKVLAGVGKNIGEGLLKHAEMNKPITKYQEILDSQRKVESDRKTQTQLGKFLFDLYKEQPVAPQPDEMLSTYSRALNYINAGDNIPTAVQKAMAPQTPSEVQMPANKAPEKTVSKELKQLSQDEIKARYSKSPGKTHEQKLKNLKKILESEGYNVTGL